MTIMCLWLFCVVILGIFDKTFTSSCSIETLQINNEIPYAKSFGLSLKRKTDEDWALPRDKKSTLDEYLSKITLDEADNGNNVGEDSSKPGLQRHRRVPFEMDSIQQRRYRSQASRRDKLNTQGLQSHIAFIKEKSLGNVEDSSE